MYSQNCSKKGYFKANRMICLKESKLVRTIGEFPGNVINSIVLDVRQCFLMLLLASSLF